MDDPVTMLLKFTTRLCIKLGFAIGDGISQLIRALLYLLNRKPTLRSGTKALQTAVKEQEREAGCKQVVLEFASAFGYMTREAISREELDYKIAGGITPEDLVTELKRQFNKIPGIVLGHRPNGDGFFEMKYPDFLRDRHAYLIGRSGSGKTNLIRAMMLQDIYYGKGVGVLAPEQEFILEEILPYIPDDRIDDVIFVNPTDTKFPIAFNPLHCAYSTDVCHPVHGKVATQST
jgi:hypothetical protein